MNYSFYLNSVIILSINHLNKAVDSIESHIALDPYENERIAINTQELSKDGQCGTCLNRNERHIHIINEYCRWVDGRKLLCFINITQLWARELFTEGATFRNGNLPLRRGYEEIALGAKTMYGLCTDLRHTNTNIHSIDENTIFTEGFVIYTIYGGKVLDPIYKWAVFELVPHQNLILNYRAYMDLSPLFVANGLDITADEQGNVKIVPRNRPVEV